jgi:acid stress-induced BolA-like protein IbaG/YrbA
MRLALPPIERYGRDMTADQMKQRLETQIAGSTAYIETDGEHFEAVVVAELFRDLNRVKQHKLVYAALEQEMKGEVHALALRTLTPEAWERDQED